MGDFVIHNFNLTALLKVSDLDIRHAADINMILTVREYYKMLSEFISLAPEVSDAIDRFAKDDSHANDWKIIRDIVPLLYNLDCEKYIPDLNTIRKACSEGDHRTAAYHAENIDKGFKNLCSQIISAKMPKQGDGFPDKDTTLRAYLKAFDEKKAGEKPLILAVDDSPAILEAVAAVLSNEYTIFKLPKPTMLENVLKQVNPDLFLLDYQMPDLNGFELIPIIRKIKEHKDTPIIFLTSEGTVDNITAAVGLGACDFIVKPFNPEQLREKVAKHIVH